jgi:hypothetical protein
MACSKMQSCSKMLSFAEIIQGRDASVGVTHDNMMIAVDLAVVLSGKNSFCVCFQ